MPATVLTYNGVAIDVMETLLFDEKIVYNEDNTQPQYVHYHIAVQGVVHFLATVSQEADRSRPLGVILQDLTNTLWQPRGRLTFLVGDFAVVDSPRLIPGKNTRFTCDCKNGPMPVAVDIVEFMGEKTALVRFEVETWVNACPNYPKSVLSHRWVASEEIDEHFMTTRRVNGSVTFSSEMLYDPTRNNGGYPFTPDDFRRTYLQPINPRMQRKYIGVEQQSDGLTVNYSVVDEEQWLALTDSDVGRGVTKIEAYHDSGVATPTGMLATRWVAMTVRAWGRRTMTRQNLVNAVIHPLTNYGLQDVFRAAFWRKAHLHVDLVRKYAEISVEFTVAPESLAGRAVLLNISFGNQGNLRIPGFDTGLSGSNNYTESLAPWAQAGDSNWVCIAPPNDRGTRGTILERLVSQNLHGICSFPTPPSVQPKYGSGAGSANGVVAPQSWTGGASGTED